MQQVDVKNGEQGGDGGQSINPISRLIQIQQVSVAIITFSAIEKKNKGTERERARVQPCGRKRDAAKERICNAGRLSFREIALNTNCGICICF